MTDEEKKAQEEAERKAKEEAAKNPVAMADALIKIQKEKEALEKENKDLKDANTKLTDSILDGGKEKEDEKPKFRTSEEIRKEIAEKATTSTNLRNAQLSVELDEAVRRETGMSSYIPLGVEPDNKGVYVPIVPTVDEIDRAERTHDTLKACLEEAGTDMETFTGGDPVKFNAALKARRL